MSRLDVPRMLTTGSLVTSATALRVTVRSSELWMQKAPHLAQLAMTAWVGGPGGARAQAAFRDDVLSLAREAADVSWREVRRGLDDFDARTRPRKKAPTARPYRPYRVKL